jgi:two-component system OmpR family response regulator
MKILLVESHRALLRMVVDHLAGRGFLVDAVETVEEARAALSAMTYDLLVLDLDLPDANGAQLLGGPSARGEDALPTIVMTARDSLSARLASLNGGADDYLPKPFHVLELEARARAVLRRPRKGRSRLLRCAGLSYDPVSREVRAQEASVDVNRREIELLEVLLRAAGRPVARAFLEQRLYPFNEPVSPNALEALVSRLRRRLSTARADVRIETWRGIGYSLVAACAAA